MPHSSDSPLSDSERAILSARADQFFDALRKEGSVPDFEPFLKGVPGPTRLAVLTELVIIDLGYRWGRGERPLIEDYLGRFPELGPADRVPPVIILEEYRCRAKAGETIDLHEYQGRFPTQFPKIRAELAPPKATPGGTPGASLGGPAPSADGLVSAPLQYELVRELGRGMFGEVWLARKKPSGIEKAVKILLQPADRDTAKREFRSLELIKNLRHPYLLATEDFWVSDNRLYIVMELADYTLRGRLKQCKEEGQPGIPQDELLGYFLEAAEGLDYLHARKITHRDVKPDNILVANGHAKVADFGLARQQEQLVSSMSFAGTPAYMAPEIWGGEGGPPSDLYGLAVAYTELRQGYAPLQFGRGADVMFAHLDGLFDFADVIGETERAVLRRGMARMPEDRYPSCLAFAEDLASALGRSVVKKSARVPVPAARPVPTPAERAQGTVSPNNETKFGAGTVAGTDVPVKKVADIETRIGRTTAADSRVRPRPASNRGLIVAAVATALLLGAVAFVLWLVFGPGPDTPPTGDTRPTNTTDNGGGGGGGGSTWPIGNGITTIGGSVPPVGGGGPVVPKTTYPDGTKPEPGTEVIAVAGRGQCPRWVVATHNGQKVRFRLIVPAGAVNMPEPFYISQSKVWNALYREGDDDAPVMNVTANEAAAFAASLAPNGRLPTPDEWDHAAGYHVRQGLAGPLVAGGEAGRVGLGAPVPTIGPAAEKAVNQFGLIDLATNGREWTAAVLVKRGEPLRIVAGPKFEAKDLVVLRGRVYTHRTPLSYEMMKDEEKDPQTGFAGTPSPYTGFRVALPLR